jgi:hypothetical protein
MDGRQPLYEGAIPVAPPGRGDPNEKVDRFAALTLAGADVAAAEGAAHSSILIQNDLDFDHCKCLTGGLGTPSNPYIIGPWSITSAAGDPVYHAAVAIDGRLLKKSFVLSNMTITGDGTPSSRGIALVNINSISAAVRGKATSIQNFDLGVYIMNSSNVTLDGGGENPNGAGISATGAGTINKPRTGAIDVENSSNITIEGWQMSASGPSVQPDWVSLDPSVAKWAVGGVRFFGVTNSLIDHNTLKVSRAGDANQDRIARLRSAMPRSFALRGGAGSLGRGHCAGPRPHFSGLGPVPFDYQ